MTRYAILFATLLGLTACNTVGGFGQDMENTGETIEGTAEDVGEGM